MPAVLVENLPGGPVESPDILFVLLPDLVCTGGKARQGEIPGWIPGSILHGILGRSGDEIPNQSYNPIRRNGGIFFQVILPF